MKYRWVFALSFVLLLLWTSTAHVSAQADEPDVNVLSTAEEDDLTKRVLRLEEQVSELEELLREVKHALSILIDGEVAGDENAATMSDQGEPNISEVIDVVASAVELDKTELGVLRMEEDRILGTQRYYDDAYPRDEFSTSVEDDEIYLYIVVTDDEATLRFHLRYIGSEWLFIEHLMFKTEDMLHEVSASIEPLRDVMFSGITEDVDIEVDAVLLDIIQKVVASEISFLRVTGKDYYTDLYVTLAMKQSMQNVLNAYESATGIDVLPDELAQPQGTGYLQENIVGRWSIVSFFGEETINEFLADGTWLVEDDRFVSGRYYFPEDGKIYMGKTSKGILDPDKREAVKYTRNVVIVDNMMYMTYDWMDSFFEYKRID